MAAESQEDARAGKLHLSIRCDSTKPGQLVAVLGEGPQLHSWGDSGRPLLLSCVDHSGKVTWPIWRLEEPLRVCAGQAIEYKYLLVSEAERRVLRWETRGTVNRRLVVDAALLSAAEYADSEFGHFASQGHLPKEPPFRSHPADEQTDLKGSDRKAGKAKQAVKTLACTDAASAGVADSSLAMPPYKRLRRIGKGKQGKCFLVELEDGSNALLKELKNGGRHAYRAETSSLERLNETPAASLGVVPLFLGACADSRSVLMSYCDGCQLPDMELAPALEGSLVSIVYALRCWLDIVNAVVYANGLDIIHCDVNPWNVLIAKLDRTTADVLDDLGSQEKPRACLVDWACARGSSESARGLPFKKRGDFQPEELLTGRVGPFTDAYGCAATLLWFLAKRTRKGLATELSEGPESLCRYFLALADASANFALCDELHAPRRAQLGRLAEAICGGMDESWQSRWQVSRLQGCVRMALEGLLR
eukprot:TRINITY_DN30695_c0_g1_i2.p1 TRINITY_DN30695_c0_g1~~TRINITY_DN30695_c0_g1_i2.p1  ORF type:complete len:477 (-),score=62.16 TRINITY_DN30695_c0_g1_i2:161-1591(-)